MSVQSKNGCGCESCCDRCKTAAAVQKFFTDTVAMAEVFAKTVSVSPEADAERFASWFLGTRSVSAKSPSSPCDCPKCRECSDSFPRTGKSGFRFVSGAEFARLLNEAYYRRHRTPPMADPKFAAELTERYHPKERLFVGVDFGSGDQSAVAIMDGSGRVVGESVSQPRSGRTTRMLLRAVHDALEGKSSRVSMSVGAPFSHCGHFRDVAEKIAVASGASSSLTTVSVSTGEILKFGGIPGRVPPAVIEFVPWKVVLSRGFESPPADWNHWNDNGEDRS